ncbi:UNVERIFIED_CONTAM: hypothetical protein FKN15_001874 [Acipenser sinensis]
MGSVVNGMLAAFEKGDVAQARKIQFQTQEVLSFAFRLGESLPLRIIVPAPIQSVHRRVYSSKPIRAQIN